jgi:hypothetical protein
MLENCRPTLHNVIRRSVCRAVIALLLVSPTAMPAQSAIAIRSAHPSMRCIDNIPSSALTPVAVYAMVDVADSVNPNFATGADILLQELVIKAQQLLGGKPGTLPSGEPAIDWQGVDSSLHLMAFRDGRILARGSTRPGTAAALLKQALEQTSTVDHLEWSFDSTRDSIPFDIEFLRPSLDSAGHVSSPTFKRTPLPLLSVRAPWERQVAQKSGGPHPLYPEEARRAGYEALVLLNFMVDSTGHVVDSTVKDVWPKGTKRPEGENLRIYEQFLASTKRVLPRLDFVPASIGGCLVNQLVLMPFAFDLRR